MKKLISTVLALLCATSGIFGLCACQSQASAETEKPDNTEKPVSEPLPLSDFTVVHAAALPKDTRTAMKTFTDAIQSLTKTQLSAIPDTQEGTAADNQNPEILIGSTNRAATAEALKLLNEAGSGENYIIRYANKKIVILGKNNVALRHAMRRFLDEYVASASNGAVSFTEEFTVMATYDTAVTVLPNLTQIDVAFTSNVEANHNRWPTYGRVVELKHNGENNGMLLATSQWAGENFPVYQSTDGGKKWKLIAKVAEEFTPGLVGNWQPHLYELPCQVGDMPAGTLLLSGCSHDPDNALTMQISIWRSFDLGKTWEQYTIVDTGNGLSNGMYEPFLICDEDGSLVCFYSDETEVSQFGGQRLVLRVSQDGKTWGEKKYCVAPANRSLRPGMVSVAKMGEHGYLIVYEMIGQTAGPVYYKVSKSLTEWEDYASDGTLLKAGSLGFTGCTPYCEWTPAGGPYGTVIAAGRFGNAEMTEGSDLFVSFDLGENWYTIDNPLEYDYHQSSGANYAYSFGFFTGSDGSLYYINNVFPKSAALKYQYSTLRFAKIRLNSYWSYTKE